MNPASPEKLGSHRCFGGEQTFWQHASRKTGSPMKFGVFQPASAPHEKLSVLFFLAGLTCNQETFAFKSGVQQFAAEKRIIIVTPDTSPRQTGIAGATDSWDRGEGAGFYLDATQEAWRSTFRMESYITKDLLPCIGEYFPADLDRAGIFGHSMGGHGALTLALNYPELFRSVSAFAPICAPASCPWGENAFSLYLGTDRQQWKKYDASLIMTTKNRPFPGGILIDQGEQDQFLTQHQLLPERFEQACVVARQPLTLRRHAGYDHGYFFISSFVADHIAFHHQQLA